MSVYTDNSERFASRDRQAEADRRLTAAVRRARELVQLRDEQARREAVLVLARAQRSAARILGRDVT